MDRVATLTKHIVLGSSRIDPNHDGSVDEFLLRPDIQVEIFNPDGTTEIMPQDNLICSIPLAALNVGNPLLDDLKKRGMVQVWCSIQVLKEGTIEPEIITNSYLVICTEVLSNQWVAVTAK